MNPSAPDRGAGFNPANRFLATRREADGELADLDPAEEPPPRTQFIEDHTHADRAQPQRLPGRLVPRESPGFGVKFPRIKASPRARRRRTPRYGRLDGGR